MNLNFLFVNIDFVKDKHIFFCSNTHTFQLIQNDVDEEQRRCKKK